MINPEALMAKTAEIAAQYDKICSLLETARLNIHSLSPYWVSEGASLYQSRFEELYPKLVEILESLKERVKELETAADIIAGGEAVVVSRAEELRTEYVFR